MKWLPNLEESADTHQIVRGLAETGLPCKVMPAAHMVEVYAKDEYDKLVFLVEARTLDVNGKPVFKPLEPMPNGYFKKKARWVSIKKTHWNPKTEEQEDVWSLLGYLKRYKLPDELICAHKAITMSGLPHIAYYMPISFTGEPFPAICLMRAGHCSRTHAEYERRAWSLVSPKEYNN